MSADKEIIETLREHWPMAAKRLEELVKESRLLDIRLMVLRENYHKAKASIELLQQAARAVTDESKKARDIYGSVMGLGVVSKIDALEKLLPKEVKEDE